MRKQFVVTVEDLMSKDDKIVLLLGDIGVYGFRNAFKLYPDRVYNIGICEQSMISMAAGLAKEGFIPIVHSIAPFVVERCFEQIKDDVCYQRLNVNIVSVGGSYDYSELGPTHQSPGDATILKSLPNTEIFVPGTAKEFDTLFRKEYNHRRKRLRYFRLSEKSNKFITPVGFGAAQVISTGSQATIIVVGPMLDTVLDAIDKIESSDFTVLYYTTIKPFDSITLREFCDSNKIVVVSPFYATTLSSDIEKSMTGRSFELMSLGVPDTFLPSYGTPNEQDEYCGLTIENIKQEIERFTNA